MTETPPVFDAHFREELDSLLAWRRDVRHFRPDPLPDGLLDDLLATAQRAPSVGNSQPWRFVRLVSAEIRTTLADQVDHAAARAGERYGDTDRGALYRRLRLHGLREAPEIMAVFCDDAPEAGFGLGAATMPETLAYSVVMAIHTLWLAARARGVALGWVSILDPDRVTALLDVPPSWRLIAVLCLGYPMEEQAGPELERRGWQARRDWRDAVTER